MKNKKVVEEKLGKRSQKKTQKTNNKEGCEIKTTSINREHKEGGRKEDKRVKQ